MPTILSPLPLLPPLARATVMLPAGLIRAAGLALLLCCSAGRALAVEPTAASRLNALLEQEWQWQLHEFPEFATLVGDHRYDDRLTDHSSAAAAGRRAHSAQFLAQLQAVDRTALQGEDLISLDIFRDQAALDVKANALLMAHAAPDAPFSVSDSPLEISQMNGPQFDLLELPRVTPFATDQDYRRYLQRLHALPLQFMQLRERLEAGRRAGWMLPRVAVQRLPAQFDGVLVEDPAHHPLLQPFQQMPESIDAATASALREQAGSALKREVLPAIRAFRDYLAGTWVPASTEATGASALPDGASWYALQLQRNNTTTLSPAQIHELGLKEVARIQHELAQVLKDAGFKGSINEFRAWLLSDPKFQFADATQELQAFRALAKRVDPQLPTLFAELPRLPYGIRAMHAEEGDNAPHYSPGASDGSRAGWFEANTNNLAGQPRWSIESLFLHESVPGHHLQIARAQELTGLPAMRRNNEVAAFAEGWALYSESLGYRLGLYTDPYTRFGRLADESLRAARLVVDTGLHSMGWTRQQAIDYLIEYGQQERGYAEAEIDRYLVWPGQATAYKVGELRIQGLRAEAEAALGPRFDIRRFHNAVIDHGSIPLTELDTVLHAWIEHERAAPAAEAAHEPSAPLGDPALRALLAAEWEWQLEQFPERATFLGEHRHDDQVTDLSAPAVAARRAHHRSFLTALRAVDRAHLSGEDRISWDIFTQSAERDTRLDTLLMATAPEGGAPWSADDLPLALNQMSGPQFALPQLVRATRFDSEADYRHYLARLARLPAQLRQLQTSLDAARSAGWMPPAVAVTRLPGQFSALLNSDLAQNPMFAPFLAMPKDFPAALQEGLRKEAEAGLRQGLIPAVQGFHDWVVATWLPAARTSTAALDLPHGREYYALRLKAQSSTEESAEAIHRIGLSEVARIDEELRKVRSESGFQGSAAQFRDWLRSDPRFRFASAEQELDALRDLAKRVDPQLPTLFAELPRLPYGVRPMSREEGNNAPHYVPGALDGSRAGYFEANLNNLAAWPSWTVDALFLHEAVPGHHLQIARAQELATLPPLRRAFHDTAYIEGWGLYAEGLGKSLGLYADPYARYGRLSLEAHRACRLVIDTGLHALGWTREQAIDYLIEHANLERGFAEAEIDRYLVWPGQATGYKMGELRILANRDKARQALGAGFDIRRFHNAVLDHGVLPLGVLDRVIDDWIASERSVH